MTITANKEAQLTEFAERVYTEQKDIFVKNFKRHLKSRIESGQTQFENGEHLSIEESKDRIYKEFFNKSVNEKI